MDDVNNKSNMTFTFEGGYAVEVTAVAKAIEALASITSITAESKYPDVTFTLAVQAVTPGSLNFEFVALVAQTVNTLYTPENIAYASDLLTIIVSYFAIKKCLKGKPPQKRETKGDNLEITSADGSKLIVPNGAGVYFVDNRIDNSITSIFEGVKISNTVTGVKITNDNKNIVEIFNSEFAECANRIDFDQEIEPKKTMTAMRKNEMLFVRKPDLLGGSQWGFKTDKYISAEIDDREFLESIRSAEQTVCAGMYIMADMEITFELDETGLPIESSYKYAIIKVNSVHFPNNDDQFKM